MRAQFIASEIGIGLRRNLTMTLAVVVTTAVSLTFVGLALMLRAQVTQMKDVWYDKVEVSMFLCGEQSTAPTCAEGPITPDQRAQIQRELESMPQVEQVFYESQEEAFERFRKQVNDSALVENITAEALPESYRVKLVDPEQYGVIEAAFADRPGVEQVQDQKKLLEPLFRVLNRTTLLVVVLAGAMLLTAVIMISTTIRLAAFSRRRETGIMRLVGASNLYIRLPFLLEGAIAGFVGAALAGGVLAAVQKFVIQDWLATQLVFTTFIGWDVLWTTVGMCALLGVALASLASLLTVRRYLRV
jgi:cell division transport system permease protein